MQVHIEHPTQPKAAQDLLEEAVALAKPEAADPATGLIRIVVGALVYIGRLFVYPRFRRFVVERCEKLEAVKVPKQESAKPTKQKAVKAPAVVKSTTKQAKRSK